MAFPLLSGRSIFPWPRHSVHAAALERNYRYHLRLYSHHSVDVRLPLALSLLGATSRQVWRGILQENNR